MPTRRRYLALVGATALAGCGFSTGDSDLESPTDRSRALVFSTSAFEDGGTVPPEFTGTGADRSPPLAVESVPERAETLALVVDDPDADGFVHWLLWNVPAGVAEISAGLPQRETLSELGGTSQGTNDFGELGYRGPLPPESDGSHSYRFSMSAVSTTLDLAAGARRDALADALEGVTVDTHGINSGHLRLRLRIQYRTL